METAQRAHENGLFRIVRLCLGTRDAATRHGGGGDELWLDASARHGLGFAVMARVRTERPTPSPVAPLTPPLVREANHAERNDAAAISEMMPEVYEDLRRLAETFLRGERTAHTLQRTALVHEAFLRLIGEKNLVWQNRRHFIGIFARVMRQARIVELRFFAGLTVEETAELLEISPATVKRDWTLAKIWLRRELSAN